MTQEQQNIEQSDRITSVKQLARKLKELGLLDKIDFPLSSIAADELVALPTFGDMITTTLTFRSKTIMDKLVQYNPLLRALSKKGRVVTVSGGSAIREELDHPYVSQYELPDAAYFGWSQYAVPVAVTGREMALNSTAESAINLIQTRVMLAEQTMINLLNAHIYGDGTGNQGKNLLGLGAMLDASGENVYAAIDRAKHAFWKPQIHRAKEGESILKGWQTLFDSLSFKDDDETYLYKPDLIIAGAKVYAEFVDASMPRSKKSSGFQTLTFNGVHVVFDFDCPENEAYFLNTDHIKFVSHQDRQMVCLDDKTKVSQHQTVKTLAWTGNLTCSGPRYQGRFINA